MPTTQVLSIVNEGPMLTISTENVADAKKDNFFDDDFGDENLEDSFY